MAALTKRTASAVDCGAGAYGDDIREVSNPNWYAPEARAQSNGSSRDYFEETSRYEFLNESDTNIIADISRRNLADPELRRFRDKRHAAFRARMDIDVAAGMAEVDLAANACQIADRERVMADQRPG